MRAAVVRGVYHKPSQRSREVVMTRLEPSLVDRTCAVVGWDRAGVRHLPLGPSTHLTDRSLTGRSGRALRPLFVRRPTTRVLGGRPGHGVAEQADWRRSDAGGSPLSNDHFRTISQIACCIASCGGCDRLCDRRRGAVAGDNQAPQRCLVLLPRAMACMPTVSR